MLLNCNTCNCNNWRAEHEIDEDIEIIFLICHGCGSQWTAQIET